MYSSSVFIAALAYVGIARETLLNHGWLFQILGQPEWKQVSLPHNPVPVKVGPPATLFQGIAVYHKDIAPKPELIGKRCVLRFDGAMQVAQCYVNGELRVVHEGGYLPFELDLTPELGHGKSATVIVNVDNRDNPGFNPGRSQSQLDFAYSGGLYRDVWLEVTDKDYIKDVYATATSATKNLADLRVQIESTAPHSGSRVQVSIVDPSGRSIQSAEGDLAATNRFFFKINQPRLWDLDHPNLYQVCVRRIEKGKVVDEVKKRVGLRHIEFDHKSGMFLNGRPIHPQGTNRHMAFPVIGNAASDNAQYREAKMLKEAGMQILRLAHYPQSPAFLDACDQLGILVIDPIPGWQFFQDTPHFREHVLSDIREMVRRDRNHPSVAIFETCLNETYNAPDEFWLECSKAAHETFGPGNFFTGGDSYGKRSYARPIWDVPWTGWDDDTFTRPALFAMQKGIDREYGDYEFGGEESTSRADWVDGESALMLQAWNFIWSHNRNHGNPWSFCDLTWEGIDTIRGFGGNHPISKSGLLDYYRREKPIAWFYRSQVDPEPYLRIANSWTKRPGPTKVVVFSNCDEVELFLNGRSLGRHKPDSGPTTGYLGPKTADPMYWAKGDGKIVPADQATKPVGGKDGALPFSGTNCEHLTHPPFTFFNVPYRAGKVSALGYKAGRPAVADVVQTPLAPQRLEVQVLEEGRSLRADGTDFVFVYVSLVDKFGRLCSNAAGKIALDCQGAARVIGPATAPLAGGVAEFMVQSTGKTGVARLSAKWKAFAVSQTLRSAKAR